MSEPAGVTGPTQVSVPTPDGEMPALLWEPPPATGGGGDGEQGAADRPALVVLQEIFGLSHFVQARSADLAGLGYLVLAPRLYWRLPEVTIDEQAPDFVEQALATMQRLDWDTAVADARTALSHARSLAGSDQPAGIVGFCFGGGLGFAAAAGAEPDPAVLVSYYGSALPRLTELAPQVRCPSLHHFGTADDYLPMPEVERITEAVTAGGTREDVEVHLHEGAGHAFDNPHPGFHHPQASARAWAQTQDFLARYLPAGGSPSSR
ncbi:dienelactone hydrolase family protein [Ornithinicoccus halotolerans]|uniref:dienelactone hydrolase family protein n=1 Tax=Ornithinicoccus halotolerans TaxID=1748220 RepID=UPI00129768D8|nr:dienelactone hydrolase family protein [Ornithinicoccus halotolerans]